MASLYKKPVKVTNLKTGKKVAGKSKKWWGRYADENGQEKRVPLATDKSATQTMLSELVRKIERIVAGLDDPFEKHQKRPLRENLSDHTKYLENKGSSAVHVKKTT